MVDIATLGYAVNTAELKEGTRELDRHAAAAGRVATAAGKTNASMRTIGAGAKAANSNLKLTNAELTNIQFQLNDIATGLISGQRPFTVMAQQGLQLTQIFGARGAGLGAVFKALGAGITSFLVNPLNLAVLGFGAAATAIPLIWRAFSGSQANAAKDMMESFNDYVTELGKSSNEAGDRVRALVDGPLNDMELKLKALEARSDLTIKAKLDVGNIQDQFNGLFDRSLSVNPFSGMGPGGIADRFNQLTQLWSSSEFRDLSSKLYRLNQEFDGTTESAAKLRDEAIRYAQDSTLGSTAQQEAIKMARLYNELVRTGKALEAFKQAAATTATGPRLGADLGTEINLQRRMGTSSADNMIAELERQKKAYEKNANGIDSEAQARQRLVQSYKDSLEMAQLELSLIGSTDEARAVAIAHLKAEIELRSKNIDLKSEEAQQTIRLAEETARVTAQTQAQIKAAKDAAAAQKQAAKEIEDAQKKAIEAQKQAYQEIQQIGANAIDSLVNSMVDGASSIEDVFKNLLKELAKMFLTLGFANPLKNALYGTNLPTAQSMGGVGNILGILTGQVRTPTAANQNVAQTLAAPIGQVTRSALPALAANDNMSAYAAAIRAVESSGNYGALGPVLKTGSYAGDRAYGAYQIMGGNIGPWSEQALGKRISTSDFMANPSYQDAIFKHRFGGYMSQYGNPQDAASAWFTGRPLSSGGGATDVLGTSGTQYVQKFNTELSKATSSLSTLGSSTSSTVNSLGQAAQSATTNLGKFSSNLLNAFPSAPSSPGGGIGGFLGSLFGGGGGFNFARANAISPMAAASIASGATVGLFAKGDVFRHGRSVKWHAAGDIVNSPTLFPMRGGGMGGMGEAGPEAIMPLVRSGDGKLGVRAHGGGKQVVVNNNFIIQDRAQTPRSQNRIAANTTSAVSRAVRVR